MENKKVALVTGASSGIGREIARIHAESGGDLVIVARGKEKLDELKVELENNHDVSVMVIDKDLTEVSASKEVYEQVKAADFEIDYLVNNAGFGGLGKFHERDWEKDRAMIQLNIVALTELTRRFLPDFVARDSGCILNVSSTASLIPGPFQAVYYATKAYVTSFSNAISEELYDTHVTVTALLPGATKTEFGKISGMDKTKMFEKTVSARSVAQDGYAAMIAGKLNVVSGVTLSQKIMFMLLPFLPKSVILKQIRIMQDVSKD